MAKKKAKKAVKRKKKQAKVEKYDPSFAQRVSVLVSQIPLTRTGGLAFGVIARALGVSYVTMKKWRTLDNDLFKPEFLAAIDVAEMDLRKNIALVKEGVELSKIHKAVVKRAQGYKKVKVTKEPVVTGPKHPSYSRFNKEDLITYAKNLLGLKLNKKLTKGAIENAIRKRIDEMTTEELKVIKVEEEFVPSDVTAAKYCDQNMGKKEKRWTDTAEVNVNVDGLSKLLEELDGSGSRLPSENTVA